jgi:hypothetical protein
MTGIAETGKRKAVRNRRIRETVNRGNADIALSFNTGLNLLAQGKAAEAYHVYHQAMGRACRSDNYRAILDAIRDLRGFVAKSGFQFDQGSPFLELLGGQFDLMRLLAYSKNWRQELRPDIFESICIQGQKLSEEDLRKLRSMLKKRGKKSSGVSGRRGRKRGGDK